MSENKSVLAVIEMGNQPKIVVDRATWLAELTGCDLELVLYEASLDFLAESQLDSTDSKKIADAIKEVQLQTIEDFADQCRKKGVKTTTCVAGERYFLDAILTRAAEIHPSFVVKGSQYHSATKRGLIVDTDWQLMRVCPYPVWLVRAKKIRDKPVVIAAVDPARKDGQSTQREDMIVEKAMYITETADGELHLFHSYHRLIGIRSEVFEALKPLRLKIDEIDQRVKKRHRDALDLVAEQHGIDAEHVHQLPGQAHELLPTFARSIKSDLVVMGALARWDITRSAIGSTAERIIDHLPCDVLVVR